MLATREVVNESEGAQTLGETDCVTLDFLILRETKTKCRQMCLRGFKKADFNKL